MAGVALTTLDAAAAISPAMPGAPARAALAVIDNATPVLIARRGADDPPGDVRRGRGTDNTVIRSNRGADNPAGDVRRGRGADDAARPDRNGADDPPGDVRRGRGRDDPPNHG
jgi:hypothetical protein